jgi:leucyl aminopeptidase
VDFRPFEWPADGNIVVPFAAGNGLTGLAKALDERTDGAISVAVREAAFSGEKHATLTLFGVKPYSRIDLIGVGGGTVSRLEAERFGGLAASINDGSSGTVSKILWSGIDRDEDATAARVAFGFRLGDYRFDRYQQDRREPDALAGITILSDEPGAGPAFAGDLSHLAAAVYLARDLSYEPGNVIYPQSFVERIREHARGLDNVRIRVLDERDLERLGMGAHLGVGAGSSRPPRLLIIEYFGGGDTPTVALAGKGITFDSGGMSLKKTSGMARMKADLAGAAAVSATVLAAAKRRARINVVALAALAENMLSRSAIRPGDVLTSMSGKTIEINSTDSEGRLVLADAVYYAQVEYEPDVLIDIATLTGSVGRAVGPDYAGLFSRHDDIAARLLAASETAGEPLWRLPLDDLYFEKIRSTIADVINGGSGAAGASIGAAFIGTFVDDRQRWAHLDIAGVDYFDESKPTVPMGYSGWGVRVLDEYLRGSEE